MSYDDEINKFLKEAYFSSPYEKATGVKRQIAETSFDMNTLKDIEKQFAPDKNTSEFRQRENRIDGVIERAAQEVAEVFQMSIDSGYVMTKTPRQIGKKLADLAFDSANHDIPDDHGGGSEGTVDAWSLPHFGKLLKRVGELCGTKTPMSQERVRHIILEAIVAIKEMLGGGVNRSDDPDMETDPEKLAQAKALLAGDLDASRQSYTYR